MKNATRAWILLLSTTAFIGCASTRDEKVVEQKVAMAPPADKPGDIAAKGHEAFLNAPGITEAQKMKLLETFKKTQGEALKIRNEFGRTKSVLFETLVSPTGTQKEINILKKKLVALDKKRLDIMLRALDDVQKIIGKNQETAEHFRRIMLETYKSMDKGEY